MDQDDPEKRIAELECRLAEHTRIAEARSALGRGVDVSHHGAPGDASAMPVSAESAAPCRFVAAAPRLGKRVGLTLLAGLSVLPLFAFALYLAVPNLDQSVVHITAMSSFIAIFATYRISQKSRDVPIDITTHSLIVNQGSGGVFPLTEANLGHWTGQGTALHLRNAGRRFVLGGRQYAVPPGVRLDAKRVYSVDAWMPASAFHTLLTSFYR
jgi:hypothetical protein